MKRFFNKRARTLVVASSFLILAYSCVNKDYELSEDKINTNVTIFQDGLTLPIGKTAPITMGELFAMLDQETQDMLKNPDGKYGIHYSGTFDISDSLAAIKNQLKIDMFSIDENFSFDLSNVSLDGVEFKGQVISPAPVDISSMLNIPQIALPEVKNSLSLSANVPAPSASGLDLDFAELGTVQHMEFASLGDKVNIDAALLAHIDWADKEMTYEEMQDKIGETNDQLAMIPGNSVRLPELPAMKFATGFDPVVVDFPVEISLPDQIRSVNSIRLDEDANVELDIKIVHPLFTSGALVPHLDIDLHEIFHIDNVSSGVIENENVSDSDGSSHLEEHIKDDFTLEAPKWEGDHIYHVDSLMLSPKDWKKVGDKLVLKKDLKVKVSGQLENKELKTTLNHLLAHSGEPMDVVMDLRFNDFSIEDVVMDIEPITIKKSIEMPIAVNDIALPSVVEKVEYIALDTDKKLNLSLGASVPEAYKALEIKLQNLEIKFPEGLKVDDKEFNEADRTISYNDVSLNDGLSSEIQISRIDLPDPENGRLSYNGKVEVKAVAQAGGIVHSKDLIGGDGGDIKVDVDVNYQPVLEDYSVVVADYPYEVKIDPFVINQTLPTEVGKMNLVLVYLENDPVIRINLEYPTADGAISILPDKDKGLRIFFPEMIRFKSLNSAYNYDSKTHSINFTGNQPIPDEILLPVDRLEIKPQQVEGKEEYCVKGEMKVEGGVYMKSTKITKDVVDVLVEKKASISFSAEIPDLKPTKLALDQYVASVNQTIDLGDIKFDGLPDIIKSVDVLDLKDVYLNLEVDASSVVNVIEDVNLTLDFDVKLPKLIKVENIGADNVLKISGSLDKDHKIKLEPVHVVGFDLSGVDFSQETIDLGEQKIEIAGNVNLENVSVDVNAIGKDDLIVSVNGNLSTRGTESIELDKVEASVDYQMDPINETISIASLLEGLADKLDLSLDFNVVHLDIDLKTNLALPVELKELSLVPYYNGSPAEPLALEEPVALKWSADPADTTHTKLRISNKEDDKHADPEYEHIVLDILSMIKNVPDSIQVRLDAGTQDGAKLTLQPSHDYVLKADYALEMPLELGEEFKIEFADTLGGLPSVMSDILAYGSVGLKGEVTNSFPIQLELEFQLLDVNGDTIPLTEGAGSQVIKACNLDGSASKTELNVILGVSKDIAIPQIDAVKLNFRATSGGMAGVRFHDGCSIQVELAAQVPEGVSVDIKDLMGQTNGDETDNQ